MGFLNSLYLAVFFSIFMVGIDWGCPGMVRLRAPQLFRKDGKAFYKEYDGSRPLRLLIVGIFAALIFTVGFVGLSLLAQEVAFGAAVVGYILILFHFIWRSEAGDGPR
jgi:hypothetical protein